MNTLESLLESDRAWLPKQPGMNPWPKGCAMIREEVERWQGEYGPAVGLAADAAREPLLARLWLCWRHHWLDAIGSAPGGVFDGKAVAASIRQGKGFRKGRNLGGNPLRDVVLAHAAASHSPAALQQLQNEYRQLCIAQGCKVSARVREDPEDWWCTLLDKLAGYSDPPGKLAKYVGQCGLSFWLCRVAVNFALQRRAPPKEQQGDLDQAAAPRGDHVPEADECVQLVARFLRAALDRLSSEARLLVYLLFVDNLQGKEAAKMLGIHPGQVSRPQDGDSRRLARGDRRAGR